MAQVFRVFKLWKADNNLEALVPQFSGDSTTIEGSGVDPQNVECDAAESGEEPRSPVFESLGDSQASDAGATLRVPQRSTVRQNSATRFMKDGLSAIRGKLRLQPRSALGASSREGDRHTEVVVYGGSAGSSVNSWGGSSASWTPPASAVPDSKYERFRSELSSSDTIRGSFKDCVSKLPSEKHTDDAARKTVRRLCELLSIEAWRVAENVFREDLSKAEAKTQKIEADLEACERGRVQALGAHLKELTALKDQIRKLPAGTTESLSISFFSPSEYLDETTNELVQRIVEEQLKTLICAAESENSLGGLNFFIRSRMKADLEDELLKFKGNTLIDPAKDKSPVFLDDLTNRAWKWFEAQQWADKEYGKQVYNRMKKEWSTAEKWFKFLQLVVKSIEREEPEEKVPFT